MDELIDFSFAEMELVVEGGYSGGPRHNPFWQRRNHTMDAS
jgi:hypothetical protein